MTGADPGYIDKRLENFVPPDMETISDPVISRLQVHLNQSAEVIVGSQASISLLNIKIGDVPEDHTTIWCAMVDIMKKLVSHGAVLDNLDLDFPMKEAKEAHILTANIQTSVDDAMSQATSTAANVGSVYATLTQLLTPGAVVRLNTMNHDINMGDKNIGVLKNNLTGLCNVVGTLEHKIHYMSKNYTAQSIKES